MLKSKYNNIAIYVSAFFIIALVLFAILRDTSDAITLRDAQKLLENHSVTKVIATKEYVYLKTRKGLYKIASSQVSPKMFVDYEVEIENGQSSLLYLLVLILMLGVGSFMFRWYQKNKMLIHASNPLDSTAPISSNEPIQAIRPNVSFDDIGGIGEVKIELSEIIDFMKNPKRYRNFGARMPRGVLLVGPPGVGKTMIAKAVAKEADVPFFYQSGASFVQIYVGMGAKRVHDLFTAAKKNAPAIIFIDEIDAVGKKRDGNRNDEREATLNQLLTEMDGFEESSDIIVIAATNKIDVLDNALLRAGRFDRRIFVDLPTKHERASIISKYLASIPNETDINALANMTVGFNGASLAALVNEAALLSLRQNTARVTMEHFYQVKDKVMFGKRKLLILNEEQKAHRVCYQAGKAVAATVFDIDFEKLLLSNETMTPPVTTPLLKHEIESRIKMLLAGVAACELKYNEHSSSAKVDLDEAKQAIKEMIEDFGMGETLFASKEQEDSILNKLYLETRETLSSLNAVLDYVEGILFERESITKNEIIRKLDGVL
ncbi:AAA family ATPase [Sulfurimonas sp. HSL-1716]|uniref:AAA family ATPase n=1 Tax=Hydrocurvibacter sulfurireducens TaxID=3131937 RepID=UPI0031F96367